MAEAVFPLRARGLTVRLGDHTALDRVSFDIDAGARIAVLGANGAGKSVLLRTLHGLIEPGRGEITWAGSTQRPRGQAMVFQRPVMLRRSAFANVEYALAVNGIHGTQRSVRAGEAIDRVGLGYAADRPARVLSGGEQQRLALARAWALSPQLMYLDEPTASLDPGAAAEVERVMSQIHASGTALVFATHVLGFARRMAHEVAFIHDGRLAERTPADRFFTAPQTAEAESFLKGELPWDPGAHASSRV
jgi:tungstate transport system ATP-binding protein